MRGGSVNRNSDHIGGKAGPPDLSPLVNDYYWRVNLKTGYREHVRRSDGFVVNKLKLAPDELREFRQEKLMSEQRQEASATTESVKYGELEITGEPRMVGRTRMVPVKCSCGVEKEVHFSNLKAGFIKSCGHLRRGGVKTKSAGGGQKGKPGKRVVRARSSADETAKPPASVLPSIDFAGLTDYLDGVVKIMRRIPVAEIEAMIAEIEHRELSLPPGDWGKLSEIRAHLAGGRRTAQAFLEFRQAI